MSKAPASHDRLHQVYDDVAVEPVEGSSDSEAIQALLDAVSGRLSGSTASLFKVLAETPHIGRLARALSIVVGIMTTRTVSSAANDGLNAIERKALKELHGIGLDVAHLGTAHAMLCVEERAVFISQWAETFRVARTKKKHTI